MLLDEFSARAALEYQTVRIAQASGAEVTDVPDLAALRRRFDELLSAPPKLSTLDSDDVAIRYALGIRGE